MGLGKLLKIIIIPVAIFILIIIGIAICLTMRRNKKQKECELELHSKQYQPPLTYPSIPHSGNPAASAYLCKPWREFEFQDSDGDGLSVLKKIAQFEATMYSVGGQWRARERKSTN